MSLENPGAYDEARKRLRESKEREMMIIEEKKEDFEKNKERIRSKKKLDIFVLKRQLETGYSLENLKSDIKEALDRREISLETYKNILIDIDNRQKIQTPLPEPEYILDPKVFPLSDHPLTKYFESQKLGNNVFIDFLGFTYGFVQGSLFLLYITGRIILDFLISPVDIYKILRK